MSFPSQPSPILGDLRALGVPRLVTLPAATIAALTSQTADPQIIYVEAETGAKKAWNPVSNAVESFSGASLAVADAITLDNGGFTYTGPAHYTLDWQGVWRYRHTNVPPMSGARLVYNWIDNSDAPGSMVLVGNGANGSTWSEVTDTRADGLSGKVLQVNLVTGSGVNHAPQARGSSLTYSFDSAPPLWFPGRILNYRYDLKPVTSFLGTTLGYFYHRPVDAGIQPTESRPNNWTLPAVGSWITKHSVMQINSLQYAAGATLALFASYAGSTPPNTDSGTYNVGRMSADFASGPGNDAFISQEYVPGGISGPGWKYFTTQPANARSNGNPHTTAWQVLNAAGDVGNNSLVATLVDNVGSAIAGADPYKGFQQEPSSVNLCTADNWLFGIGYGKMSSTGPYTTTPPLQGSTNYGAPSAPAERLRYEVESMARHPYQGFNATITFVPGTPDVINNSANTFITDGWKIGDGIWAWMGNEQADGTDYVGVVTAVTAGQIQLSTNNTILSRPTATGRRVRLYRIPKVDDQVLLLTNSEGGQFRTTITSVTRPTYSAVNTNLFQDATYGQKQAIRVGLTAAPTEDGGFINTDGGVHFFYWTGTDGSDFGIAVSGGTGGAVDVVYDREAMRAAGLDDIAPHGLCLKLSNSSGNTNFDFGNAVGAGSKWSALSIFAKKISGGTTTFGLQSHGGATTIANSTWARILSSIASASAGFKPRVITNSGPTVVYVIGAQFEQSAVSNTNSQPTTSPIVNAMKGVAAATQGATRAVKRMTRAWGKTTSSNGKVSKSFYQNNFTVNVEFTPAAVMPNVTQCIAACGTAADGWSILLGGVNGDTWTARKSVGSTNYDSSLTLTPVPGTTYTISVSWSSVSGTTFTVNGNAGGTQGDVRDISGLSETSSFDLGSLNGASGCFGTVRKAAAQTYLLG